MCVHRGVGIKQHLIAGTVAPNVGRDVQHDHGILSRLWRRNRTCASRVIPADSGAVNCHAIEGAIVVFAAFILPQAFAPVAHASAVDGSHLADVVLAFDEALSLKLAERMYGVGVKDRFAVDAGAHHLKAFEMTVAFARRAIGLPHGPASAGDIEVVDTVDDFGHHIAQVGLIPDVDGVFNRIVTVEINLHKVVAFAETLPTVEARFIKRDGCHRVVGLFVFVQVDETYLDTVGVVGAVEQHVDVD